MSATPTGVPTNEVERERARLAEEEDAKLRAEHDKAAPKSVMDLPEDHPLRRRATAFHQVEIAADDSRADDSGLQTSDAADAAAKKEAEEQAKLAQTNADAEAASKQLAAQTEEVIFTPEQIAAAKVRVKVDGVEELVPAEKVFRQYQKGAAADMRLAEATKARDEAKAAAEKAQKDAQQAASTASTPAEKAEARTKVEVAAEATKKFKEASDALFEGDSDKAAQLFKGALEVALANVSVGESRRESATVNTEEIVSRVSTAVKQELSQESALTQLFKDYPEIKADPDYQFLVDRAINAKLSSGNYTVADAIREAGEDLGEKFKLGKHRTNGDGRPLNGGGPTTRAEKLAGKENLDTISSGDVRSGSTEEAPQTPQSVIEEMRKSRPGEREVATRAR